MNKEIRDCENCVHRKEKNKGLYVMYYCEAWTCVMDEKQEVWKDVVGYEGYYEVSNQGRLRSVPHITINNKMRKGILRKPYTNCKGYLCVQLCKDGITKAKPIHRLVAEAFIPNPHGLPIINHKDEDRKNNNADNLEWCDYSYNNNYGRRIEKVIKAQSHPVIAIKESDLNQEHYLSLSEAGRKFNIHPTTITRAIKSGKVLLKRKWYFAKEDNSEKA